MTDRVTIGPLYEKVVKMLMKYRRLCAQIFHAKPKAAGTMDHTIEILGERIEEMLGELSDGERSALIGWRVGFAPDVFELYPEELMELPYKSIRRTHKWTEEWERHPVKEAVVEEDLEESKRKVRELLESIRTKGHHWG